ncbi:MAG TPA: hypothetical protein GXZ79_01525 [Acholeplasma sp.]|nr:hypothetical protein [Acholeplasma sp.]
MFTPPSQEVYSISVGDSFTIPTVTATDAFKQDIAVTHTTDLNTNVAGVYEIFYTATNEVGTSELKITVYVIDENTDTGITIIIQEEVPESIYTNENITLPNATAYDFIGNQLDVYITPNKVLNIKNEGSIEITYYAVDSFGNYKEIKFTLTVIKNPNVGYPEPGEYLPYYQGVEGLTGTNLKNELNRIISVTATSYEKVKEVLVKSDVKPNGKLYLIYDSKETHAKWDNAATWNREHVWPDSKLSDAPKGESHNLRASDVGTNSSRGNDPFARGTGSYGRVSGGWYPGDEHIGDVARIIMFMIVRYPQLNFGSAIGSKEMFLEWHLKDPVDDFERNRNNVIHDMQGNRNPFIDHPELAQLVFN